MFLFNHDGKNREGALAIERIGVTIHQLLLLENIPEDHDVREGCWEFYRTLSVSGVQPKLGHNEFYFMETDPSRPIYKEMLRLGLIEPCNRETIVVNSVLCQPSRLTELGLTHCIPYEAESVIKTNQVWRTKSNNLALIVKDFDRFAAGELRMIWWDTIDQEFVASALMNRLETLTELTPSDFYKQVLDTAKEDITNTTE